MEALLGLQSADLVLELERRVMPHVHLPREGRGGETLLLLLLVRPPCMRGVCANAQASCTCDACSCASDRAASAAMARTWQSCSLCRSSRASARDIASCSPLQSSAWCSEPSICSTRCSSCVTTAHALCSIIAKPRHRASRRRLPPHPPLTASTASPTFHSSSSARALRGGCRSKALRRCRSSRTPAGSRASSGSVASETSALLLGAEKSACVCAASRLRSVRFSRLRCSSTEAVAIAKAGSSASAATDPSSKLWSSSMSSMPMRNASCGSESRSSWNGVRLTEPGVFFSAAFTDLSLSVCTAGLALERWTSSVGRGGACESSLAAAFARTTRRLVQLGHCVLLESACSKRREHLLQKLALPCRGVSSSTAGTGRERARRPAFLGLACWAGMGPHELQSVSLHLATALFSSRRSLEVFEFGTGRQKLQALLALTFEIL